MSKKAKRKSDKVKQGVRSERSFHSTEIREMTGFKETLRSVSNEALTSKTFVN